MTSLQQEKVWKPFFNGKNSSYLLIDEFSVRLMSACVGSVQDCSTEVDFILNQYTDKLQVLDVGVNKPFKQYIKQCFERFMVNNIKNRKVNRLDVAKWVAEAWENIAATTITNTWNSIGFVNEN